MRLLGKASCEASHVSLKFVASTQPFKMASNIPLGVKEVQQEHSGDESDDDVDDVVEQSPCGRWEKRRQEVKI